MKDIYEAIQVRLRSPLFGYFLLSFISLNWKGLYYLTFAGDKITALEKIQYFHDYTSIWSTLFWPFVFATIFLCAQPWVRYLTFWVSDWPNRLNSKLQMQTEHELLVLRQEYEKTRSKILSQQEDELIERAKRDEKVSDIGDSKKREDIQAQINELRNKSDNTHDSAKSTTPQEIMEFAKQLRTTAVGSAEEQADNFRRARQLEHEAERILRRKIKD